MTQPEIFVNKDVNGSSLATPRLLLVEDDIVDRKACIRALTRQNGTGYEIIAAETGLEGLKRLASESFDCILLDMHLPDMLGLDFIAELQLKGNSTPTIVLTGVDDLATAVEAMKRGVLDYLVKDGQRLYLELLHNAIARVLREQALIDARTSAEEERFRAQAQFRILVEQIPAITYIANGEPRAFSYVSPQIQVFGFDRESWLNAPYRFMKQLHHEDRSRVIKFLSTPLEKGKTHRIEYRLYDSAGQSRWVRDEFSQVYSADGTPLFIQGIFIDITEDKQIQSELQSHRQRLEQLVAERTAELALSNQQLQEEIVEREKVERALHEEKEFAQVTLASIGDAVLTVDIDARIIFINPTAESLVACSWSSAVGQPLQQVCIACCDKSERPIQHLIHDMMCRRIDRLIKHPATLTRYNRQQVPISISAAVIHSRTGDVVGAVLVVRDVTHERQLTERLNYQATHDELTRLVNRREFENRLERAITVSQKNTIEHALCFIDLDGFKAVNDISGHAAGDALLKQLSQQLAMHTRQRDTLARMGGDEFAVLLEHCNLAEAKKRAETIKDIINRFRLTWKDKVHSVGASVGVMMVDDNTQDVASILKNADNACYEAKVSGRNRVIVFADGMHKRSEQSEAPNWGAKLSAALSNDNLLLFCQPFAQLQAVPHRTGNCEILLRMIDDQGNRIPPAAFLPAAERKNLMPQVDRWVIRQLLHQIAERQTALQMRFGTVFWVNLSCASLNDVDLPRFIQTQLAEHDISPAQLGFEISETSALQDLVATVGALQALRDIGVGLALDNVHGALTTIDCLQTLPLDFIKMDGSLIQRLTNDPVAGVLVGAINRVAHEVMVVQTVAESVESEALITCVRSLGVNHAQGFALAIPSELTDYLGRQQDAILH